MYENTSQNRLKADRLDRRLTGTLRLFLCLQENLMPSVRSSARQQETRFMRDPIK